MVHISQLKHYKVEKIADEVVHKFPHFLHCHGSITQRALYSGPGPTALLGPIDLVSFLFRR